MKKKDYFVRSCIYNHVCVVGKKGTVYQIVEKLQEMQSRMEELAEQIKGEKPKVTTEEIRELQTSYEDMLRQSFGCWTEQNICVFFSDDFIMVLAPCKSMQLRER